MKQKTEYEKECQTIFEQIRHLVGTTHQVPEHLDKDSLYKILGILKNMDNRF